MTGTKKRHTARGLLQLLASAAKVVGGSIALFYLLVLITAWV